MLAGEWGRLAMLAASGILTPFDCGPQIARRQPAVGMSALRRDWLFCDP
jgi:hypothetical protein